MKKTVKILLCMYVLATVFFVTFTGKEVQAAAKAPVCAKKQTIYYATSGGSTAYSQFIYIKNLVFNAEVSNVKSSNPKIEARPEVSVRMPAILVTVKDWEKNPVKSGDKSRLSFSVKQNGKTYKLYCDVTYQKAKSPFKSLKMGNKEYASSLKGKLGGHKNIPQSSFKLTYQAAPGFKITAAEVYFRDGMSKKVKSGVVLDGKNVFAICFEYCSTKKPENYQFEAGPLGYGTQRGDFPSPLYGRIDIYSK